MKVLALDYGSVHTGAAVSDPTGSIVRPLEVISIAGSDAGRREIAELVTREDVKQVIVGMPVTLKGETGVQAGEAADFIRMLKKSLTVPVIPWDERFTSKLAEAKGRFSSASEHSLAACVLLEDYLGSRQYEKDVEKLYENRGEAS